MFNYFLILTPDPFIMVRVAMKEGRLRDYRNYVSTWREIRQGFTGVLKRHGLRLKDMCGIDGVLHPLDLDNVPEARVTLARLESAYSGDPTVYPDFSLYEWNPGSLRFDPVRKSRDGKETVSNGE